MDNSNDSQSGSESLSGVSANTKKRQLPLWLLIIIILLSLVLLSAGGFTIFAMQQRYTEVGDTATLGALENNQICAFLCRVDSNVGEISTDKPADHEIDAKLFGFIPIKLKLTVRDTIPPEVTYKRLSIMQGMTVDAAEFVSSCSDKTDVSFTFESQPDFNYLGEQSVTILAEDEGGNVTTASVIFDVTDKTRDVVVELGLSESEIYSSLSKRFRDYDNITIENLDTSACAAYRASANDGDSEQLFELTIADTTAPKADARSWDILLGDKLELDSFADNIIDASDVTISCMNAPDYEKIGEQTLSLTLTDNYENSSELCALLRIHNIAPELTIEAGFSQYELANLIFANAGNELPRPSLDVRAESLVLGTNELTLKGEFNDILVKLTVVDTKAPVIALRDITTEAGILPSPSSFVLSCSDATAVSYRYETEPSVKAAGEFNVTIIATDAAGNQTRETATLNVFKDTAPPIIYGTKNITAYEGDTISYRAGVYAEDAVDGRVTVYVDSSKVKTSTAGSYTVTYTATDSSGNRAKTTVTVTIKKVTQSTIDSLADGILSQIITNNMTEREKAKAIYDWCRGNIKYSTVTSYLMGNYLKGAYSGFKLHYGNCYIYYAVAHSLLTRAGITNQMIQRNSTKDPHYWNLVNIDGSWYHFDTCPQPAPYNDGCFLLTDSEVAEYSKNKNSGYYSFNASKYPATP
ncbi:MAG: HYR domain-containing protein [Clostridiales bacterium]|nr:HYR domain-containing protein [Clostridiales bacterium]